MSVREMRYRFLIHPIIMLSPISLLALCLNFFDSGLHLVHFVLPVANILFNLLPNIVMNFSKFCFLCNLFGMTLLKFILFVSFDQMQILI